MHGRHWNAERVPNDALNIKFGASDPVHKKHYKENQTANLIP